MLCLLTSNVQYLNNLASRRGPGSRGRMWWRPNLAKRQLAVITQPQAWPQTLSIPSGVLCSGPSHRPEQRVKWNTGTFEISPSPPIANVVWVELLYVIYIRTFRCSIQLALFGMILWFLCLLAEERVMFLEYHRDLGGIIWKSTHPIGIPASLHVSSGKEHSIYTQEAVIWELQFGKPLSHLNLGSCVNLSGPCFRQCKMGLVRWALAIPLVVWWGSKRKMRQNS